MNDLKKITACFTGHRQVIHDNIDKLLDKTITELIQQGIAYFGVGGAVGFDFLAAESVLRMSSKFPHIKLIVVVPYKNYYNSLPTEEQQLYMQLLKRAHKIKVLSENYYNGCMHVRNKHLADHSSVCICYMYKNTGGTAFTVDYARKKGLKIVSVI